MGKSAKYVIVPKNPILVGDRCSVTPYAIEGVNLFTVNAVSALMNLLPFKTHRKEKHCGSTDTDKKMKTCVLCVQVHVQAHYYTQKVIQCALQEENIKESKIE